VHNDIREEGKGRSVQGPHERLKFDIAHMVVPLLFLEHMCIASLTDYSKVGKIAGRQN